MQPLDRFALIRRLLCREAIELRDAEPFQVREVIPETAGLRRAAARTGDCVPARRQRLAGPPRARIDVDDGPAGQPRQIDRASIGRREGDSGQLRRRLGAALRHRPPAQEGRWGAPSGCAQYRPLPALEIQTFHMLVGSFGSITSMCLRPLRRSIERPRELCVLTVRGRFAPTVPYRRFARSLCKGRTT